MKDSILLHSSNDVFKQYQLIGADELMLNLSQINLFIGANNSGKSFVIKRVDGTEERFSYKSCINGRTARAVPLKFLH